MKIEKKKPSSTGNHPINWDELYSSGQIKQWGLPIAQFQDPENGVFRDLLLNWSQLSDKTQSGDPIPMWRICCDVLLLEQDMVLDIDAIIYARTIILKNGASLILDLTGPDSEKPGLTIFASQVLDYDSGESCPLIIQGMRSESDIPGFAFSPSDRASGYVWPPGSDAPHAITSAKVDPAELIIGEPLRLFLMSEFQVATLLSTEEPELAIHQLKWIGEMGQANEDTQDLVSQALSLATSLTEKITRAKNSLLVPQLDYSIYGSKAQACMDLLRARETAWSNLENQIHDEKQWAADAKASLDDRQIQFNLDQQLQAQAQKARDQALYARNLGAQQVVYERAQIAYRKIDFDRGVEEWKKEMIKKEVIKMVLAVGDMAIQVGTIVAAGPEIAALPAIKTAADVVKTIADSTGKIMEESGNSESKAEEPKDDKDKSKKTAATKKKLKDSAKAIGKDGKGIVDAAMNIYDTVQKANELVNTSAATVEMADETTSQALSSDYLNGLDTVTGGSQEWDILTDQMDIIFKKLDDYKISGKEDLHHEINCLIIAGKAYGQAQLALAKANAELAEKKLRTSAAKKSILVFEKRYQELGAGITKDETIAALLYNKVLDSKRAVFLATEAYQRAFAYFSLVDKSGLPALPKITDTIDDFVRAVSMIAGDVLAISSLDKPPQSMGKGRKTGPAFLLNDDSVLNHMRTFGSITWELHYENTAFKDFSRIRLNCVRVFLEGVSCNGKIEIQVATSGVYTDKVPDGGTGSFVGKPMRFNFVYDGQDQNQIIFDGDIAERYEDDFFHPTPFSTWTIKAVGQDGSGLDFSTLTGIRIEFGGEATSCNW